MKGEVTGAFRRTVRVLGLMSESPVKLGSEVLRSYFLLDRRPRRHLPPSRKLGVRICLLSRLNRTCRRSSKFVLSFVRSPHLEGTFRKERKCKTSPNYWDLFFISVMIDFRVPTYRGEPDSFLNRGWLVGMSPLPFSSLPRLCPDL